VAALAAGDAVVGTEWITITVPAIDVIIHGPMSYAWATALCCIHIYIMLSSTNTNIPYLRQETMCSAVVNLGRLWYVVAGSNPLKTTFFAINASGPPARRHGPHVHPQQPGRGHFLQLTPQVHEQQ
jgi:hypothetical protein